MKAIYRSDTPRQLRVIAGTMDESWQADLCKVAADEIELLERVIIHDPIELPIEEGDRANG